MAKTATKQKSDLNTVQILRGVRLLWPSLYEKPVIDGKQQDKYMTKLILHPKDHAADIQTLTANMRAIAEAELGVSDLSQCKDLCLRKLNFDGLEDGLLEVSAKSTSRPFIVDRDGTSQIGPEEKDRFYSGVICNVKIDLWTYDNKWGKGVSANLHAVQFVRDAEPIVGGRMSFDKAIEGFEDVAGGDLDFL